MITKLIFENFICSEMLFSYRNDWELILTKFYKNPSSSEVNSLGREVRGFIDKNGNLFVWNGWIDHGTALDFLNKKQSMNFSSSNIYDIWQRISPDGFTVLIEDNCIYLGESIYSMEIDANIDRIIKYMKLCRDKNPQFKFYTSKNNSEPLK